MQLSAPLDRVLWSVCSLWSPGRSDARKQGFCKYLLLLYVWLMTLPPGAPWRRQRYFSFVFSTLVTKFLFRYARDYLTTTRNCLEANEVINKVGKKWFIMTEIFDLTSKTAILVDFMYADSHVYVDAEYLGWRTTKIEVFFLYYCFWCDNLRKHESKTKGVQRIFFSYSRFLFVFLSFPFWG